jgi:hypothetical protein
MTLVLLEEIFLLPICINHTIWSSMNRLSQSMMSKVFFLRESSAPPYMYITAPIRFTSLLMMPEGYLTRYIPVGQWLYAICICWVTHPPNGDGPILAKTTLQFIFRVAYDATPTRFSVKSNLPIHVYFYNA